MKRKLKMMNGEDEYKEVGETEDVEMETLCQFCTTVCLDFSQKSECLERSPMCTKFVNILSCSA